MDSLSKRLLHLLQEQDSRRVHEMPRAEANALYDKVVQSGNTSTQKYLCRNDLFFLLTRACKRRDVDHDWLYARCREVQASPDGHLDLWSREHYKSSLLTFAKSIQDLLINPEELIGIFSHTRPIAKGFLDQIKRELEQNEFLKALFPDVLYENPRAQAPKWSLDSGIIVKRKTNPKEASVEAWGLVDGQPTGKHFTILVYDDVVTLSSVSTPDQIKKVTQAWQLSLNLGAHGGKRRAIGTRYHINDTYRAMIDQGSVIPRIHPATVDGKIDGEPVFLSKERLTEKRRDMGSYVYSCQMLQDPVADRAMSFREEWPQWYEKLGDTKGWNKILLVDPASAKKATSDYTVMWLIGLAPDQNYYMIDAVRDRMNLTQRAEKVFEWHRKYNPQKVGYERYGMQADIEHIKYLMEQKNYRFPIIELGGQIPKEDRIKKLIPVYEQKRFYLPKKLPFIDGEGVMQDFIKLYLTNEYLAFPVCVHDDMLDCQARILDPGLAAEFPKEKPKPKPESSYFSGSSQGWMG
jgi:phage terminase large subunit-like protein